MKRYKKSFIYAFLIIMMSVMIYVFIPDHSIELGDYGKIIYDRQGEIIRTFLNEDQQWCFKPRKVGIPERLQKAALLFEDRFFFSHPGINPVSILKALKRNISAGRIVSGGSTITMQVCRLANPGPRTLPKKLSEMLQAIKLEIKYSKSEILGLYLNNAPYGGNIKGVRAAALKYFQREPQQLSWAEAALLAVLPNDPARMKPGNNTYQLKLKRDLLLKKLFENGEFDSITLRSSLLEPLPGKAALLPQKAMHFTDMVDASTNKKEITTTLDLELQGKIEEICQIYRQELWMKDISNLAVLIADNKTCEIIACIGSADYWDSDRQGKVNGVLANRSPGSILKPFLYALSIDDGLILPQTRILDVPSYFGAFSPENASHTFSGWVTAHDALVKSLNVPAVRLLNIYGYHRFYNWLEDAGISTLFRSPSEYGLTLIVGGCEVNMMETTSLFCALANYGEWKPLRFLNKSISTKAKKIMDAGSCWQILNILDDLKRPGIEYYWQYFENQKKIAWKTGTSYGHRDAWAIGTNPRYTVAVWTGNFSGAGNNYLSGAATAAPLLFRIFRELPTSKHENWFEMPLNAITTRAICAETGLAPSRYCPRDTVFVPRNAKPLRMCNYHQPFQVDEYEENTLCSLCWKDKPHHTKVFLVYPPQVRKYLLKSGQPCPEIPPHSPQCPSLTMNNLSIIYPAEGALIFLPRDLNSIQQMLSPQISVNDPDMKIYWYLDNEFVCTTTGKENIPLLPDNGNHTLTVIDASGNSASSTFQVRLP